MSAGAIAAGLGAALLLAGGGFASPSLLVAGAGLFGLGTIAFVWVRLAVAGLHLERAPGPARIVEGEPYPLELRARGGRLPLPGGELRDDLIDRPQRIGPRWNGRYSARLELSGRGRRTLRPAEHVVGDPLGLERRTVRSAAPGEVLVLPRLEAIEAGSPGSRSGGALRALTGEGAGAAGIEPRAIELEVDGLRPHREGSPASRIHWPAVARTGELIERRLVAGGDSGPLVVLDASRPAGEAELDSAVRAAASLVFHLARGGGCAAILPGERRPIELDADLRGWPELHARYALVTAGARAPSGIRHPRWTTIFWVSAAASGEGGPPALATRAYLVSPSVEPVESLFSVAGCRAMQVGGARRRPRRGRLARIG